MSDRIFLKLFWKASFGQFDIVIGLIKARNTKIFLALLDQNYFFIRTYFVIRAMLESNNSKNNSNDLKNSKNVGF